MKEQKTPPLRYRLYQTMVSQPTESTFGCALFGSTYTKSTFGVNVCGNICRN